MLTATNRPGRDGPQGRVYGGSSVYGKKSTVQGDMPKKPKGPVWAKVLIGFGALMLVMSVGAFAAVNFALKQVDKAIEKRDMLGGAQAVDTHKLDGPLNILLVGTDERPGLDGNRADTIIVMHVNAAHDNVYLLSVPRDTLAQIPAFPKAKFKGSKEKINAAFEHGSGNGLGRDGGFELLATTVSQVTGLTFNAGAIINFDGFTAVVEALGGVHMCIDAETTSLDHDFNGNELFNRKKEAMVYKVGCRDLLPWQALDYVRQRKSLDDGDYGRQRHQQQFIKAIAKAALSQGLTDPIKLNRVLTAAGKALTVDLGSGDLTDWVFLVKGLPIENMIMLAANGGKYASVTCPDGSSCQVLNKDSLDMFAAVKGDTLPAFIRAHPTWVAEQSGTVAGPSGAPSASPSGKPSTPAK